MNVVYQPEVALSTTCVHRGFSVPEPCFTLANELRGRFVPRATAGSVGGQRLPEARTRDGERVSGGSPPRGAAGPTRMRPVRRMFAGRRYSAHAARPRPCAFAS